MDRRGNPVNPSDGASYGPPLPRKSKLKSSGMQRREEAKSAALKAAAKTSAPAAEADKSMTHSLFASKKREAASDMRSRALRDISNGKKPCGSNPLSFTALAAAWNAGGVMGEESEPEGVGGGASASATAAISMGASGGAAEPSSIAVPRVSCSPVPAGDNSITTGKKPRSSDSPSFAALAAAWNSGESEDEDSIFPVSADDDDYGKKPAAKPSSAAVACVSCSPAPAGSDSIGPKAPYHQARGSRSESFWNSEANQYSKNKKCTDSPLSLVCIRHSN